MRDLTYETGMGAESIALDGDLLWAGTALGLRGWSVEHTLAAHSIGSVTRPAREVKLTVTGLDSTQMDRLQRLTLRDVENNTPGRIGHSGWWQRCLVVALEATTVTPVLWQADLTLVLLDGAWSREVTSSFNPSELLASDSLDLPYDLPYDLTPLSLASDLVNSSLLASPARLTIYGPCATPYVIIGGNKYMIDVTVPAGGYLVVDGREGVKTVTLITASGDTQNVFSSAHRGEGAGKGEYVFEKIRPGRNSVTWPNTFGFDVTIYEQEAGLPWSQ